ERKRKRMSRHEHEAAYSETNERVCVCVCAGMFAFAPVDPCTSTVGPLAACGCSPSARPSASDPLVSAHLSLSPCLCLHSLLLPPHRLDPSRIRGSVSCTPLLHLYLYAIDHLPNSHRHPPRP